MSIETIRYTTTGPVRASDVRELITLLTEVHQEIRAQGLVGGAVCMRGGQPYYVTWNYGPVDASMGGARMSTFITYKLVN